jgi:hypothetical protein
MATILRGGGDRAALGAALAATPDRLRAAVAGATDEALDRPPAPGEWPARTVLAHLRDDEFMVIRLRIERIVVEDEPALVPFDEQAWAAARWRGADALEALLDGFALQRRATVAILERLDDASWRRLGRQPEIGTFDLHWWVEHALTHDEAHVAQAARALRG